jgi:hypothetical protein
MRSSALDLPPSLRGQDRILEIARRLRARRYVNAPGGRSLYDAATFDGAGVELRFLPDYAGPHRVDPDTPTGRGSQRVGAGYSAVTERPSAGPRVVNFVRARAL